jgi:hypothetical protein
MRLRKQNLATLLVLIFSAVLALPAVSSFSLKTVEAGAQAQARNDVKPVVKNKRSTPHIPQGGAANDNCASAISVNACPFTDSKDTSGAGDEAGEPQSTCTLQANSVWYTLPASANTRLVKVSTCTSDFDTAIMVYQVTGAACAFAGFVPVGCNDDFCGNGLQSTVDFTADPGQTYKIQVGGFDGDTGNLTVDITCQDILCDNIVVNGQLGLGSPDHPAVSGQQTPARLFRDGIASTCAAPKVCPGPFSSGSFTFDAYTFTNESGEDQCVQVNYDPNSPVGNCNVNAHAIAYLNSFSPTNLCLNYLADVGSSDALPFSFTVPAGADFVIVIAANSPGAASNGCAYKFTVVGNICEQFDFCVQDDNSPGKFIKINSTTGAYEFHDCSKGISFGGTGVATTNFCKITLTDAGPNPKRPDRSINVLVNPCTGQGDASVRPPGTFNTTIIGDSNIFNNTCECPINPPPPPRR